MGVLLIEAAGLVAATVAGVLLAAVVVVVVAGWGLLGLLSGILCVPGISTVYINNFRPEFDALL